LRKTKIKKKVKEEIFFKKSKKKKKYSDDGASMLLVMYPKLRHVGDVEDMKEIYALFRNLNFKHNL
jgi:hypothetical protein